GGAHSAPGGAQRRTLVPTHRAGAPEHAVRELVAHRYLGRAPALWPCVAAVITSVLPPVYGIAATERAGRTFAVVAAKIVVDGGRGVQPAAIAGKRGVAAHIALRIGIDVGANAGRRVARAAIRFRQVATVVQPVARLVDVLQVVVGPI